MRRDLRWGGSGRKGKNELFKQRKYAFGTVAEVEKMKHCWLQMKWIEDRFPSNTEQADYSTGQKDQLCVWLVGYSNFSRD